MERIRCRYPWWSEGDVHTLCKPFICKCWHFPVHKGLMLSRGHCEPRSTAAGGRSLLDHSFFQPIHNVFQTSGLLCRPVALLPVETVTFCITRLSVRCQTPCTNSKITSTYIFCNVPVQTLDKFALIFVWCKQRTCPVAYLQVLIMNRNGITINLKVN